LICLSSGCRAEYAPSNELITKMKSGQNLHVQGINGSGQPINIPMPLADFAKAYDGPPIDPKELEQQEKK
jgi:invasion protein IalB